MPAEGQRWVEGKAVGACSREWLQRGELITRGEGSRFAPGVDVPYLRDRFQAHGPAPGQGTREEQLFFS